MTMESKTQVGYLVLADISGFTSYLAQVELDHAHEVLRELLETIVGKFKTLLTLSKLEGDAVFAYASAARVPRGETLLELMESTYVAFRDQVEAARRRTTCQCRACRAIPSLDLKFFIHHGDYVVQHVSGIRELVGSDVNLIHRLTKNHISEATGWRAYALFTERGLAQLGVRPEGLHEQVETYEHLGDIQTYALDMRSRYEALIAARRAVVAPEEAHVITAYDYPVPPPVLWDWLNDPQKRGLYSSEDGLVFVPTFLPNGRTGVGAKTHCIHGKKVFMIETVLDWRPFEEFTVDQAMGPLTDRITFRLAPIPSGTHVDVYERGRLTSVEFIDRLIAWLLFAKLQPTTKMMERLAKHMADDLARQQADEPASEAARRP